MTEIVLEAFTRVIWPSAAAREAWAPRLELASHGYQVAERESVAVGVRAAGQVWIDRDSYLEFLPWAHSAGLHVRVVRWTGSGAGGFLHTSYPVGRDLLVVAFARTREQLDAPLAHLGYPSCCEAFFAGAFPADVDPVPAWAGGGPLAGPLGGLLTDVAPHANPLLRYVGVRAVPHIPCSPTCPETVRFGRQMLGLMPVGAAGAALDLLSLPMTWDRYRGVVIVTTPHFRVIATSTARAHREVLHVRR